MNFKKQLGMLVAAMFAATAVSFAQSYSLVPNDTIILKGMLEDLETLTIQQQNISNSSIQLKWKKVSESVPALWDPSVCDNRVCYTSLVDSGSMNPVNPADFGFVLLHITPHVNYGTAVIRYEVWDINTPLRRDTLTYILTVSAASGIKVDGNKNAFNIFPNPAKESINVNSKLQTGFQFMITDVLGKEIEKGISKTNTISFTTENLPTGIYTISILAENRIIATQKIIIQK